MPRVNYIVTHTNISEPDEWELPPEKLSMKNKLGEGAFGVVRKGYYYREDRSVTEVAIKMLKGKCKNKFAPSQSQLYLNKECY